MPRSDEIALDRRAVVAELLREPADCPGGELLVVTGLGSTTYDAGAAGDRAENFYLWGAMGGAAMIGLPTTMRAGFLTLITMRGEWGEFNGWQVPMGQATEAVLSAMGVHVKRADRADEVVDMVAAAAMLAFASAIPVAVLFSQRLIGAKVFVKPEGK